MQGYNIIMVYKDEYYFDDSKFAGEGNIGHMIEQVNIYGSGKDQ